MDVIGVVHLSRYVGHIEHYLNENYNPGSVMLEIDPKSEENAGYFVELEKRLSDRWDVIGGDVNDVSTHKLSIRLTGMLKEVTSKLDNKDYHPDRAEKVSDLVKVISGLTLAIPTVFIEALNPFNLAKRNRGMIETIHEKKPDVAVVGALHAFAIKKQIPDSNLTLFLVRSLSNYKLLPHLGCMSMGYRIHDYETVWYPRNLDNLKSKIQ